MAHHLRNSVYSRLTERLNRFPQGAPPSPLLHEILKMLVSEQEAGLIAQIPIKPFTAEKAAAIWKMEPAASRRILDNLAGRAVLVDIEQEGEIFYTLPPPMAGFFEFSMMRVRHDFDQKLLSELFHQYLNVEEDFIRELFTNGETQLGRVFVHEPALAAEQAIHVLDFERASEVIQSATSMGISMCYCRHKMQHLDKACQAPMHICMTFNTSAASLIRHGHARPVDKVEGMELLHQAWEHKLVQFGENVRQQVNFICNCCGCCCEAMLAAKRFGMLDPVHTSNYLPEIDAEGCSGCGRCVDSCPVEAMALVSASHPDKPRLRQAQLLQERCLGCGLCVRSCPENCLRLVERDERVITPLNSTHRAVVMALERGKLQHLIFDNRALYSHRALAAIFGVILRLPPLKQILAHRQVKSRYLEVLISRLAS